MSKRFRKNSDQPPSDSLVLWMIRKRSSATATADECGGKVRVDVGEVARSRAKWKGTISNTVCRHVHRICFRPDRPCRPPSEQNLSSEFPVSPLRS